MDPPTESRARALYLQVLDDLETVRTTDGEARDAVLLRVSDNVGELAKLAEGAQVASAHEGSWQPQVFAWVARISWELVKVLSDTDFYIVVSRDGDLNVRHIGPLIGSGYQTAQARERTLAA